MASIKIKFRFSSVPENPGSLYFQISHKSIVRNIFPGLEIFNDEWNQRSDSLQILPDSSRFAHLVSLKQELRIVSDRISRVIKRLEDSNLPYSADDIVCEYNLYTKQYSLFCFMNSIIAKLKEKGDVRTSETYQTTLNIFRRFRNYEDIMLDSITGDTIESFEVWNRNRGIIPNTISFYNRILRAVYNRAVALDEIENRFPFRHAYTGIGKTQKRALPIQIIRKIKETDLSEYPAMDYARDMFMLSFYFRGMSFVDMAGLKKENLQSGYIIYRRRKTGQRLSIKFTREMQQIISKYPDNPTDYLLPIITSGSCNFRSAYRNMSYRINYNLKNVARLIGLDSCLTMYVARHSWASAAKAKGIPLQVISEGMGHDSETTTRIYLASLESSAIDKANSLIIKLT